MFPSVIIVRAQMVDCDDDEDDVECRMIVYRVGVLEVLGCARRTFIKNNRFNPSTFVIKITFFPENKSLQSLCLIMLGTS